MRRIAAAALIAAAVALLSVAAARAAATQPAFDLLFTNARIVNGTGSPWFRGEIGVRGDTIAAIAPKLAGTATRTIDVQEQMIAPGFIDIHTHARRGINTTPTAANYVRQGVTTVIEGPDG